MPLSRLIVLIINAHARNAHASRTRSLNQPFSPRQSQMVGKTRFFETNPTAARLFAAGWGAIHGLFRVLQTLLSRDIRLIPSSRC